MGWLGHELDYAASVSSVVRWGEVDTMVTSGSFVKDLCSGQSCLQVASRLGVFTWVLQPDRASCEDLSNLGLALGWLEWFHQPEAGLSNFDHENDGLIYFELEWRLAPTEGGGRWRWRTSSGRRDMATNGTRRCR